MPFNCRGCGLSYVSPLYLNRHKCSQGMSGEAKTFKCPTCNCAFIHQRNFERHKKFCKNSRPAEKILGEIGNKFQHNKGNMANGSDLEIKQGTPKLCDKTAEVKEGIAADKIKDTLPTANGHEDGPFVIIPRVAYFSKQSCTRKVKQENLAGQFICQGCNGNFSDAMSLHTHFETHRRETVFVCPHCDKTFLKRSASSNHALSHERDKNFTCRECNAQLCDKRSLERHSRIHTGERPFVCAECKKSFSDSGNLHKHLLIHSGVKPFACKDCDKAFTEKKQLVRHSRVHTGDKIFVCTECPRKFCDKDNLANHLQTHTGEKPFLCTKCDKRFPSSSKLRVHLTVHSGEKPYRCAPPCNVGFFSKSNLRRHLRLFKCDKKGVE